MAADLMLMLKAQYFLFVFTLLLVIGLVAPRAWAITEISIKKSKLDQRQYKGLYLNNGLRVILVSDPLADKAAVSLNVQVGGFNNPVNREGLAHFLEHMLFLGTEKYPQASEYSEYISRHGGFNNAWTSNRNTQYYFDILPENLPGALDRFAQFFIAPLFNTELVDRERHAVDSEYHLSIKKDNWRVNQVSKVTANPDHPIVRFDVGSLDTLGDDGREQTVREDLIAFYKNYYSAERMTLVIVAPQSIKEQEKLVKEYFSAVPKLKVKPNQIIQPVLTSKETAKFIQVESIGDYQELSLVFPIPSQREKYQTRSINYILYQFNQTEPHSLYAVLKNKNWISDIHASENDVTYNQDIAQINFTLTEDGLKHIDEIVQHTLNYVDFLRKTGPQEGIFNELRMAGQRNFMYTERMPAIDYVSELSEGAQRYPIDQVLTASAFNNTTKFDPSGIKNLLKYFSPDNMRLILVGKQVITDTVEPYYQVKYSVSDFTSGQLSAWQKPVLDSGFALPAVNEFMPKDFSMRNKIAQSSNIPENVLNTPGVRLWHKQSDVYKLPKQDLMFLLRAPEMESTPRRQVLAELMAASINDKLSAISMPLAMAGVSAKVSGNPQGLTLEISMFSDQELKLTQAIFAIIQDYKLDPIRFVVHKDELTRDILNFKQNHPFRQGALLLNDLIKTPSWMPEEMLAEIAGVSIADVETYTQEFLRNVQIESLMHGNITKETAVGLIKSIAQQINVNTSRTENLVLPQLLNIANGKAYYYTFNPMHDDAALVSYFQAQEANDSTIAVNALLTDMLSVPLFEQLRTNEQLGYAVGVAVSRVRERTGIMFYVESPSKNANYLNSRFFKFINEYKNVIANMPLEQLNRHKDSLRANLLQKPSSLSEETSRYWSVIIDGTYRFNLLSDIAATVSNLTGQNVLMHLESLVLNPATVRRISVVTEDSNEKFADGEKITNVAEFKASE